MDLIVNLLPSFVLIGGPLVIVLGVIFMFLPKDQWSITARIVIIQAVILLLICIFSGGLSSMMGASLVGGLMLTMFVIIGFFVPKGQMTTPFKVVITQSVFLAIILCASSIGGMGLSFPTTVLANNNVHQSSMPITAPATPTEIIQPHSGRVDEAVEEESSDEIVSEPEPEEVEVGEPSSIFDLGSVAPDGRFSDGVSYFVYEVKSGDTIYNIRHRYGVSEAELLDRNDLDIRRPIIIGQDLMIPIIN